MEILSPLFTVIFFLILLFVCQKAYQVFCVYKLKKNLNDYFYQQFQFFVDQAIHPYYRTLFSEGHQQEVMRIHNMTWQEIASVCNLEMYPTWNTSRVQSIYKNKMLKSIILNQVKSDVAKTNPEVQHQLCIFFERVLDVMEKHKEEEISLGYLFRMKIMQKLFENYANTETQAKFEKRILPFIVEEE